MDDLERDCRARVDLYWLPLGAGGHSVRVNGRVFEAVASRLEHRPACDLYHSALELSLPGPGRCVVEMAPVTGGDPAARGALVRGPVGARWAGRLRLFSYEVRRWPDGRIPDVREAVASPQRLTEDELVVRRLWGLVPAVPSLVWGRDEARTGEMWNSNSITAWLLARAGLPVEAIRPPAGGRAPGWGAGLVVARRTAAGAALGAEDSLRRAAIGPLRAPSRPRCLVEDAAESHRVVERSRGRRARRDGDRGRFRRLRG